MKQKPSKFNKESYDRSNQWGINLVTEYLISKGYVVKSKDVEDMLVDIVASKDGIEKSYEVEVKTGYKFTSKDDFKFDTVSFLGRKQKYKNFWYIIICRETKSMIVCHSDIIYQEQYKEKIHINSQDRKGEDLFFRVPKDLCYWIKL